MKPANIELHIEELVLHGFEPGDRHRIGEAVQRELTRLFGELGAPARLFHDVESRRVDAGSFEVAREMRGETIGVQVAQAVYGGLDR